MADAAESLPSGSGEAAEKDYLLPAGEILGFQFLLNQFDRRFVDHHTYASNGKSIRENLKRGWVIDKDPFSMNQFGHPYTGATYHGFARSSGLSYWEALPYDFVGSAVWEVAGETDPPSLNDQITTSFAGSFLGEALFRTADLVLRRGGEGEASFGRKALATVLCPTSAINRLAFGDRFKAAYPGDDPAVFYWLGLGARRNARLQDLDLLTNLRRDQGVLAVGIDYGLPGKPGYDYDEPFDYYHLEATATTSRNAMPENIAVRGLLYGSAYESGPDYRGIWGLYGSYDYFAPEIFKVSSTGLSLGTTGQYLISDKFALQGTCTGGIGFTAAGTSADRHAEREYHYSASPQALLALRLVYDDVAMLDFAANDYFVGGNSGSSNAKGNENIIRAQMSITVRVYERHALGIQFVQSQRDRHFSGIPDPRQSVGALSLFYTFLGDEEFGVVRGESDRRRLKP